MPLAGYLGSVWSGYPVKLFGVVLPGWGTKTPALKDAMSALHLRHELGAAVARSRCTSRARCTMQFAATAS